MPKAFPDELVFLPLGGLGEIGMNLALYGVGPLDDRKWLMVDCGVSFAGPELPGVDLITPDIRFAEEERRSIVGIVITHAHEDHYGALYDLWPRIGAPVYMTPFAAGLLEAKRAMEREAPKIPVTLVEQGGRCQIGPFDVEFLPVAHSMPEPNALAIRTDHGTVLHTGDWKIDPTPGVGKPMEMDRFAALGDEGVLAMVCDSTNAVRDGISPSEAEVGESLKEIVAGARNRVAVTIFASNLARIRSVALAAAAAEREIVVAGRAIRRVLDVAGELGYLDGLPEFLDEDAYGYLPPDKVVVLMTGSQGEPRAALAKSAAGEHRNITLSRGDLVIFSSRTIPGNEKAVGAIQNALVDKGIRILTDRDALIHVSGHPRRDELTELYERVKPRIVIPAHGEAVHLEANAALARSLGVPRVVKAKNGEVVRLAPGKADVVDAVPSGILVKDGRLLAEPALAGVSERRKLSFAGIVTVTLVMSAGESAAPPVITLTGLPVADDNGEGFSDIVAEAVDGTLESIPKPRRRDPDLVAEAVRRAVRNTVNQRWGKKPLCEVRVARV